MKPKQTILAALVFCALGLLSVNPAWANADMDAQENAASTQADQDSGPLGDSGDQQTDGDGEDSNEAPDGLDIVMDGTSLDAWNQSMERVKEVGGEKQYAQLQDAFDYLLMFDIGAKNNPEILASRLNGLTGNQIVERVKYGRGKNKNKNRKQ
jgi:hypothetical protein